MKKNKDIEYLKNNVSFLMECEDDFATCIVTLEQFGGGVDVEDNTPAMEAAIRAGGTIMCKPHGTYKFGDVVNAREIAKPKTIIGNGACFKNFCMEINLKPDTYDWNVAYNQNCLTIENLYFGDLDYFVTDTNPTRPSVISGMPVVFKNCRLRGHYVLLAYINRYIDLLTVDNLMLTCDVSRAPSGIQNYNTIMFIMEDGTLVKEAPSNSAGDIWTFSNIMFDPMKTPNEDYSKYALIDLYKHNGVTFTNIVQATITIGSFVTAKFQSCHFETYNTGVLLHDDSANTSVTFDNCYFYANCNYPLAGDSTVYNHCHFRIGNDEQGCYTKGISIMRNAVCNQCVMNGTYRRASSTDFTKSLTINYLAVNNYSEFKITKGNYGVGSYKPAVFTGHVKVTAFLRNFDSNKYHYKKIVEELDCDEAGNSIWVSVSSYGSAIIDAYIETEEGTIYHGTIRWTAPVGMVQLIMIKSYMVGSGKLGDNYNNKDRIMVCDTMEIVDSIPESTEQPNIYQVAPGMLIDTTDTVKKLLDYIFIPSSSVAGIGSGALK